MKRSYWASVFFGGGVDFPPTVRALEERGLTGVEVPQVYGPPFAPLAVAAGADVLVAGSAIFDDGEGIAAAMQRLRAAVQR